jgi:hypothetical protein
MQGREDEEKEETKKAPTALKVVLLEIKTLKRQFVQLEAELGQLRIVNLCLCRRSRTRRY